MELSDLINLYRICILEETEDFYRIGHYDEHSGFITYNIAKDTKTSFALTNSSPNSSQGLKMRLEQRIIPETGVFQDKDVPPEFKEVMMFHEIREMQYKEAGFEDAHKRAVNDELLYIMKFFSKEKQAMYLKFATEYRWKKTKQEIIRHLRQLQQDSHFYENGKWKTNVPYIEYKLEELGVSLDRSEYFAMRNRVYRCIRKFGTLPGHEGDVKWDESESRYMKESISKKGYRHKYGGKLVPNFIRIAKDLNERFHNGKNIRTRRTVSNNYYSKIKKRRL